MTLSVFACLLCPEVDPLRVYPYGRPVDVNPALRLVWA